MTVAADAWRRILLDRRAALLRARMSLARDERELLGQDASEPAERSAETTLASVLDALDDRDIAQLQEIADALMRVDAGRFGRCVECKEPIPARRLESYPAVARCTGCAQERELRRRTG
jgi:RNA polymerase-binding transcription factor DksA